MKKIIECVPNFSEGRDNAIIQAIAYSIKSVEGVKLLEVDPGVSTNRTVMTFVGEPERVIIAAYNAIKTASELIDMRKHHGEHPRMGATDVCPLVPVSGITVEETVQYSHILAEKVGNELNIPVYMYEFSTSSEPRKNLADIRAGEYEGFRQKLFLPEWKPDYGPVAFNETAGQTVIGVRDFLVAYNINLNTRSVKRANSVAFDIREKGRVKTIDGSPNGKPILDEEGEPLRIPGACKHVKAIGWYIEEYGISQVSCNLTNIIETPLHVVFEEAVKSAFHRGLRVTGSELVGLIPKKCLLDAGSYFLEKQKLSSGVSEGELIHVAIKTLGLDELGTFDPKKKIIEFCMEDEKGINLTEMSVRRFNSELASDSPAPGGGSVAALCGALAASLGTMVANLSAGKKGWESQWKYYSDWAVKGQELKNRLLYFINEDTAAFNGVLEAIRLPKGTPEEKETRKTAMLKANKYATLIPSNVMIEAFAVYELLEAMIKDGNPNSVSDAGVGVLCVDAAIQGTAMNVLTNLSGIADEDFKRDSMKNAEYYRNESDKKKQELLKLVYDKI